uniref:Uncharacterized protein n=1 Tax=Clytia hemisphaerica TaxID=252671 RepID=A0A7M5XFD8_9CNID
MAENPEQPPPLERGYDFVLVVKEQGVDFECSICRSILRDAHSTPCHHAFCRNCLATWTKELEQGNRPITCPNCNLIFDPKKVQYNGFVDRMVKTSLEIKCKQEDKGCHWQGEIIDYQDHQGTCDYELVECQNKGCREVLSRKELVQHQKDCKYRTTECLYCRLIKPIIEMKDHHSECQMMKIICPNEQCETQVLRKDIKEHLNKDCLYEKISCCYSEIGCQKKIFCTSHPS